MALKLYYDINTTQFLYKTEEESWEQGDENVSIEMYFGTDDGSNNVSGFTNSLTNSTIYDLSCRLNVTRPDDEEASLSASQIVDGTEGYYRVSTSGSGWLTNVAGTLNLSAQRYSATVSEISYGLATKEVAEGTASPDPSDYVTQAELQAVDDKVDNNSATKYEKDAIVTTTAEGSPVVNTPVYSVNKSNEILQGGTLPLDQIILYNASGNAVGTFDGTNVIFTYNGIEHELGANLYVDVRANGDIANGDIVQYSGSIGVSGKIEGKKAVPSEINLAPYLILGVATQDISNNADGKVNFYGLVSGIDTTNYNGSTANAEGQIVWFDSTSASNGEITKDKPVAPNVHVGIGTINVLHATNGQLSVRPQFGLLLGDLHDVYLNGGVSDGDIIKYNATNSRWEAYNLDNALNLYQLRSEKGQASGYVPLNASTLIDSIYLPSYVDDVIEYDTYADMIANADGEGEQEGKIYVVIADENNDNETTIYRWSGSVYVQITDILSASEVKALYESNPDTNAFTDDEQTKLASLLSGDNYYNKTEVDQLLSTLQAVNGWETSSLGTLDNGDIINVLTVGKYDVLLLQIYDTDGGAVYGTTKTIVVDSWSELDAIHWDIFKYSSGVQTIVATGSVINPFGTNGIQFFIDTETTDAVCEVTGIKVKNDTTQLQVAENSKDIEGIKNTLAEVNPQQTTEVTKEIEDFVDSLPINVAKGFAKINAEGLTREQLIENGDFEDTSNLTAIRCSLITSGNELVATNTGTTDFRVAFNYLFKSGITYFVKVKIKTDHVGTSRFAIMATSGAIYSTITSFNSDYDTYILNVTPTTDGYLTFQAGASGTSIIGETITIDGNVGVFAIPITNTSWASLTTDEIASKISEYWEDEKSLENLTIQAVGKNLFDKSQYTDTDYAYKITIKSSTDYVWSESVAYKTYDINGNELSSGTATTVTSDSNAHYIAFANTIADTDAFQLEQGTSETTYEEYISAEMILKGTFRSVGTAHDNIILDNNDYKKEVNVAIDTSVVKSATGWSITSIQTNTHIFYKDLSSLIDYKLPSSNANVPNIKLKIGDTIFPTYSRDDIVGIDIENTVSLNTTNLVLIRVNKTTYPTSADLEAYLQANDVTFTYEVDTPSYEDIQVIGNPLLARPNQTIIQYDELEDAGVYDSGVIIQHQNSPISELTHLVTVDLNSGIETEVTLDNVVVAGDGLSFTSTDLADNQIVFFKYKVSNPNLATNIDFIYYDSRYVLIDTADNTPYKLTFTITNGVINFNLEDLS